MRFQSFLTPLAAIGLASAPVAASAANPAASLSVASSPRAASPSAQSSDLAGGGAGLFAIALVAGILAIIVIAVINDEEDDPRSP